MVDGARAAAPDEALQAKGAIRPIMDWAAALAVFALGLLSNVFTVLNNAYSEGATLYDSTIFQTIIWRSGWSMRPAPTIDDISFFNTHFSPINYIPDLVSYLVPLDRMTYFGVVYGVVYGGILVLTLISLRGLFSVVPAVVGTLALYLSGEILNAQWEPHQEITSALLTLGFFVTWSGRRTAAAITCLVLNAAVREDCGMLLALPLFVLAAHDVWIHRAAWRRQFIQSLSLRVPGALGCALLSTALSVVCFVVKKKFFSGHDVVAAFYYGDAFNHLTGDLLRQRLDYYLEHAQYLWLPGIAVLGGAVLLRDARIAIGWIAFFPYWLFSFLSQGELNADMGSYKAFPFVLSLLWPALLLRIAPESRRKGLAWVQAAVLAAGCVSYEYGQIQVAAPTGFAGLSQRWLPQPAINQAPAYRAFESRLDHIDDLGRIRASQAVLALYPYAFARWDLSSITDQAVATVSELDSLMWFEGDRDAERVETMLAAAHLPHRYRITGTRMWLATRLSPDQLTAFDGSMESAEQPVILQAPALRPDPR